MLPAAPAIRVADPLAAIELLSFGEPWVNNDPNLILRIRDAAGRERRPMFPVLVHPPAHLAARLLGHRRGAGTAGAQRRLRHRARA